MNTDNIKIISCDLDGTLLNANGDLSDYSISVLLDLQDKGYCLVLNSGRFYHELDRFIKQLKLEEYGGYVICSNGFAIFDCKEQTSHSFESISYEESMKLFHLAKKMHVLTFYYTNRSYYICASRIFIISQCLLRCILHILYPLLPTRIKRFIPMFEKTKIHTFAHISTFKHVEKLCFIQLPFFLTALRNAILNYENKYQFFDVNTYSIELVKCGVSKADAISFLCEKKGYTLAHVIAFGDAGNDIPLLKQAGIGVLMKNAHSRMKAYTNIQTEYTNADDGVAKFLSKHLLSIDNS